VSTIAEPMTPEDLKAVYLPTAAEIAEACRLIRAGWSEAEERSRRVFKSPAVESKVYRAEAS